MKLDEKQQNIVMWCVGGAIGALILYYALLNPLYFSKRADLDKEIKAQQKMKADNESLVVRARAANKEWDKLQMREDENSMEYDLSQVVSNAIGRDAGNFQFARTTFGNAKPLTVPRTKERTDVHTDFTEIHLTGIANTTTSHIGRFLQYLEKYAIDTKTPAKIEQIKLTSRKPGSDDISLEVQFAALVYTPRAGSGGSAMVTSAGSGTGGAFDPGYSKPLDPPLPEGSSMEDRLKARRDKQLNAPATTSK